jgi:hypothetical protein
VGFELGWDYAHYLGWHPDDERNKHFIGGFTTARQKIASTQPIDRFFRKWLQLRYGAWRRGKSFDHAVTPAFLAEIDCTHCPILGLELTHSSGQPTDWSVDRLNNHGGYAVGNLAVMSTLANSAKGNHSFDDILLLASLSVKTGGLSPLEWTRLASLLTGPYSVIQEKELLFPLCINPPAYLPLNLFQELQLVVAKEARKPTSSLLARLIELSPGRGSTKNFKKMVQKIQKTTRDSDLGLNLWLQSDLLGLLEGWYLALPPEALVKTRNLVEKSLGSERVSEAMKETWALRILN